MDVSNNPLSNIEGFGKTTNKLTDRSHNATEAIAKLQNYNLTQSSFKALYERLGKGQRAITCYKVLDYLQSTDYQRALTEMENFLSVIENILQKKIAANDQHSLETKKLYLDMLTTLKRIVALDNERQLLRIEVENPTQTAPDLLKTSQLPNKRHLFLQNLEDSFVPALSSKEYQIVNIDQSTELAENLDYLTRVNKRWHIVGIKKSTIDPQKFDITDLKTNQKLGSTNEANLRGAAARKAFYIIDFTVNDDTENHSNNPTAGDLGIIAPPIKVKITQDLEEIYELCTQLQNQLQSTGIFTNFAQIGHIRSASLQRGDFKKALDDYVLLSGQYGSAVNQWTAKKSAFEAEVKKSKSLSIKNKNDKSILNSAQIKEQERRFRESENKIRQAEGGFRQLVERVRRILTGEPENLE